MHFELVAIYFFYGLGFFTMGLVMALESFRTPSIGNAYQLLPLAIFGIIHGIHEWMEIFLLQMTWLDLKYPEFVTIIRLYFLGVSFLFLLIFGINSYRFNTSFKNSSKIILFVLLGIYYVMIFSNILIFNKMGNLFTYPIVDANIRYLMAFPASILAFIGFFQQSKLLKLQERIKLSKSVLLVGICFLIYGLTQLFVHQFDMFPAKLINQQLLSELIGFPIQLIRAFLAVAIMIGLVISVSKVEEDRNDQFVQAQKDRLSAMEQIQEELTRREGLRKELLKHTVRAQEDERARIARELHDETSQLLSAFSLDLGTLKRFSSGRKEAIQMIERLQSLGKQMSQGIFRLVHDLRPAQLDDLGLVSALIYLTQSENCPPGFHVKLEIEGDERRLDPIVETVLFRVAQEALSNSFRYSQSDHAIIRLIFGNGQILLRIEDQGVGFDPSDNFSPPRGWGLAGMQERVDSVEGELKILSSQGNGTTIEAVIPSAVN
jgi:signal transduction histidine kinase